MNGGYSQMARVLAATAEEKRIKFEAPKGKRYRVSSDSVWPLRAPDGRTFAERKGG
jgi:hypothetical protein